MELAEKANISMNFLSEIERGNKWPYPETLQNLAESLGVEVFELFRPEAESVPGMGDYMRRFSNDVFIAVQESVKKSINNVKKQYGEEVRESSQDKRIEILLPRNMSKVTKM